MPSIEKSKYDQTPKNEWNNKEQLAVPDWHLPYINNQLLQLRAQGKQVDGELLKRFYHLPHSVTDDVENVPTANGEKFEAETFKEKSTANKPKNAQKNMPSEHKDKKPPHKSPPAKRQGKAPSAASKWQKNSLKISKTNIPVSPVPENVAKSLKSLVDKYLVRLYFLYGLRHVTVVRSRF